MGLTRDSEYSGKLFIDNIIWPEEILTKEIFQIVTIEKALDAENFAKGRAMLLEYKLDEDSILVGKKVRETIKELGGTMPEDLPTVDSIKKREKEERKRLENKGE